VRWQDTAIRAVDSAGRALDFVIGPDRACRWKDEDEFAALTGQPGFWTMEQAEAIRRDGQQLIELASTGTPPFDGRWTDYRPDPDRTVIKGLPDGWDRPHPALP
jgi:hypothetical protein